MSESACQGFEIAIEMRRHGAADPEASRRLDEHLLGCAACRSYEQLGGETEVGLRTDAEEARAKVDLDRLRARGRMLIGSRWSDFGSFYLFVSVAWLLRVGLRAAGVIPGEWNVGELGLPIIFLTLLVSETRRRKRALDEASTTEALFREMRKDVNDRLVACLFFTLFSLGLAVLLLVAQLLGRPLLSPGFLGIGFAAGLATLAIYVAAVRMPVLLREQREIPRGPDPYEHYSDWLFGLL